MRVTVFAAAVLSCFALAAAAGAQPQEGEAEAAPSRPRETPAITAAAVAAAASPHLPFNAGDGETLSRAIADGSLLILTYEVSAAAAGNATPEALAQRYLQPFCESRLGRPFFAAGNRLRIDSMVAGAAPRQGAIVTRCP